MYKLNSKKYLDDSFNKELSIKKRKKIAEIVTKYSKNPNIIGIILVGSLQGLPRDRFSDFDFFLIYDKSSPTLQNRIQFIQKYVGSNFIYSLNYVSNEYGISDDFNWADIEVCTSFYSLDEVKKFIRDVYINMDYKRKGFYYPMAFVAAISDGSILFERNNILSKFKQQCKLYPEKLKNKILSEEKGFLYYYQDRMNLAAYRNDSIYFDDLIHLFVDSSLQTIFAYNQVHFYSKKELDKKIQKLEHRPNELAAKLKQLIEVNDDTDIYNQKKEIAKQIAFSLEKYNSYLPDYIDKVSSNDSSFFSNRKKWLLSVSIITATAGIAFFKLRSKNIFKVIEENLSYKLYK